MVLLIRAGCYILLLIAAYLIIGPTFFSFLGVVNLLGSVFLGIILVVIAGVIFLSLDAAADDAKKHSNRR